MNIPQTDPLTDRLGALAALVRSAEDDTAPALDYVQTLRRIIATAESALPHAVALARGEGASWEDVAGALGTSRQAAWERFRA